MQPQEFRAARVEVVGFDEDAVLAALRLRLAQLPIKRHGGPAPAESPHVYVRVERGANGHGALRVITSDGRAYERGFLIEVGQEVRVAASTVASLIYAVEQGAVAPDRKDVAIPEVPGESAAIVPDPPSAAADAPLPRAAPSEGSQTASPGRRGDTAAWELGANLHGAAALGLGPPRYPRSHGALAGGGGGLGLEFRSPRGGLAAFDLRGIGLVADGLGVGRMRISIGGGYAWRRGRFEVPVLVAVAVEPWWATRAGAVASIASGARVIAGLSLIGGYLRVSPGLRISRPRGPLAGVRVGPRLELGGSFALDNGAKVVGLADPAGVPQFRLGGLEMSLGLELSLQFAVASKATRRSSL